jgi:hypothetical protein
MFVLEVLLGVLLIGRTISTVLGYDEEKFFISTPFFILKGRICEVMSFFIWLLITVVTITLSLQIRRNIGRYLKISLRVLLDFTVITPAILYEFWVCAYIYETYALGCDLMVQFVIFLPVSSIFVNSLHQYAMFADKSNCLRDVFHMQRGSFLPFMIVTGLAFNIVMIIHLFCMAYSNIFNASVFGAIKLIVMILGLAELYFRVWMVWRYFKLIYYIRKHPLRRPETEGNANTLGQLVIGRQYGTNNVDYAIQPHQATMDIIIIYVMPPLMLLPFLIIPGFL